MPHRPQKFLRPDRKLWYVVIRGKQYPLGPDEAKADAEYHRLMNDIYHQKPAAPPPTPDALPVVAILDSYLEWCADERNPQTFIWYQKRIQSFVSYIGSLGLGRMTVDQLKPKHVEDWTRSHKKWAPGMKRGAMIAVQRAFNWARKRGDIDRAPLLGVEKPDQGRRDVLISQELFAEMVAFFRDQEFRDLLEICWETGCRPQEVFAVAARHVDLEQGWWHFPKEEAKGKKHDRIIYLNDKALAITRRAVLKNPQGPIFRNTDGEPWTPFAVNCRFGRFQQRLGRKKLQELGIKPSDDRDLRKRRSENEKMARKHGTKYCLYNLRHSWCTRALLNGLDTVTCSVLMGHSDGTMVAKVYQHLAKKPDFLRDQARKATG